MLNKNTECDKINTWFVFGYCYFTTLGIDGYGWMDEWMEKREGRIWFSFKKAVII